MISAEDNFTDLQQIPEDSEDIVVDKNKDDVESLNGNSADEIKNNPTEHLNDSKKAVKTKIETKNVKSFYNENTQLISFLKDNFNHPISNGKISISINNNIYNNLTDNEGKAVFNLNLKPGTYHAVIHFNGEDNKYISSFDNATIKIKKAPIKITTYNNNVFKNSKSYFKAKIINKITKNPIPGVKVAFKVYYNKKCKIYYATTDDEGIAQLKKNFKIGSYKVITYVKKNKNVKSKKTKDALVVETSEYGCCSLYVQVSNKEAVAGFRRDETHGRTLNIVKYKLADKTAVKQYKLGSYFFHSITTADGWMAGTGGRDNPSINHAIERIFGKMAKAGKIKKSYLRKIHQYEKRLGIGHFSIKAPNGKYAVIWPSGIKTGKLKPGEYLSAPNARYHFRHGTWHHFSNNPSKAAIKVAASDKYGVNRRDVTAFHWLKTTSKGSTTSKILVYAANDNGKAVGRSTGHLKDNIKCFGKYYSKNKLPKTPSMKYLGKYVGKINKYKKQTVVSADHVKNQFNTTSYFKILVKDKSSRKAISKLAVKFKIGSKIYKVKTNKKGLAKFNTKSLNAGKYKFKIYTDNDKYFVSKKSKIIIKE